jgi:rare lipoprotein A
MRFVLTIATIMLAGALMSGCAETEFVVNVGKEISDMLGDEQPQGRYKVGKPYKINGKWYYPAVDYDYDEVGYASWYGPGFHGKKTANGEIYNENALTAAHKTLPMPSIVRVTNLENNRVLVVRINDRGPYVDGRIIDLSRRAAQLLGMERKGVARVRVEVMEAESRKIAKIYGVREQERRVAAMNPALQDQEARPPRATVDLRRAVMAASEADAAVEVEATVASSNVEPATFRDGHGHQGAEDSGSEKIYYVQAGAFRERDGAEAMVRKLMSIGPTRISEVTIDGAVWHRVRLGPFESLDLATALMSRVMEASGDGAAIVAR